MCRFSSAATRASSRSQTGSPAARPVLRCEIRVASSWKDDVRDGVQRRGAVVGGEAGAHVGHACRLQRRRVDGPAGEQVVPHHHRVPGLLGRPPVHPGAPRAVQAEQRGDLAVVAGEVVLGQQVDDHRGAGDAGQRGLPRAPRPRPPKGPSKSRAPAPRHVLVRHPVAEHAQVAVELARDDLLQVGQQTCGVTPPRGRRTVRTGRRERACSSVGVLLVRGRQVTPP